MSEKNKPQNKSTDSVPEAEKNIETVDTATSDKDAAEPIDKEKDTDKQDTSTADSSATAEESHTPIPVAAKKQSNTLGLIALLIAGGTLAGGYYLWQQNIHAHTTLLERLNVAEQNVVAAQNIAQAAQASLSNSQSNTDALTNSVSTLQSQSEELANQITQLGGDIKRSAENIDQVWPLKEGQQTLKAKLSALNDEVNALKIAPDISRTDWLLAESRHLINIANHQSQLNNNKAAAVVALETANQRLGQIDNPSIGAVRQVISDTIIALRNTAQPDVASIAQAIANLERDVNKLQEIAPGSHPDQTSTQAPAPVDIDVSDTESFFSKVWHDIQSLVVIRRASSEDAPVLLPPGQRFFLQQNLRLKLEAARIALLSGDTATFHSSLKTSRNWLNTYFDMSNTTAANMLTTLSPWESIELRPTLPNSDNALRALAQWQQRNGHLSYSAPATSAAEVTP